MAQPKEAGGDSEVLAVRKAIGDTQEAFAKRLGVGVRTLARYEIEGTLPRNAAVRKNLQRLAKQAGIELPEDGGK